QKTPEQVANPNGTVTGSFPNVMNGLRCIPVNGKIYAFGRSDGKFQWKADAFHQMLVVDQFKDLPILLCTAQLQKGVTVPGGVPHPRGTTAAAATRSIDKRTGKLLYDKEFTNNRSPQFFSLLANPQAGTIELVGYQMKIVHYFDGDSAPPPDEPKPVPGVNR